MKQIELTEQEKKDLETFKEQMKVNVAKLDKDAIKHDLRQIYIQMAMLEIMLNELNLKDKNLDN